MKWHCALLCCRWSLTCWLDTVLHKLGLRNQWICDRHEQLITGERRRSCAERSSVYFRRLRNWRTWFRKYGIPYVHGCVWDRECRSHGAPLRISLHWGRHMFWVDLPGYYRDPIWDGEARREWHWPSFRRYSRPR